MRSFLIYGFDDLGNCEVQKLGKNLKQGIRTDTLLFRQLRPKGYKF